MRLRLWTFAVVCFAGVLLGTLGTWSWRLGHGYSAIWPAIAVQVTGGIWFGAWGVLAGTLFPVLSNALAGAGLVPIVGYIPANFAQAFIPAWAFRHFRVDARMSGAKGLRFYAFWGAAAPALAGALLGSAAVVLFGEESWKAYPLLVLKWAVPHTIVSCLIGIPLLRILTPLWASLGLQVSGWWGIAPSAMPREGAPRFDDLPIQLKLALAMCGPGLAPLIALSILEVKRGHRLIDVSNESLSAHPVPIFLTISIVASIVGVGWLSRQVIRPILELKKQVENLKDRDTLNLTVRRKDEIGQVGRAFLKLLQERQGAEEAARREQERFRRLIEESPVAIAVFRRNSPLYANVACLHMFGYEGIEELRAACVMEQVAAYAKTAEHIPAPRPGIPPEYEATCSRRNGTKFPVRFTFTSVHFDEGSATMAFMQDVTEQKQLEQQLRESQKMEAMGKLAGGVAHDFNNLMTIITGYGNLLRPVLNHDRAAQEKIEQILKAGEQATSLTRQLLAFTRRQIVQPKIVDVAGILSDMGDMLRRVVSEDLELDISPSSEPCLIYADPGQVEQVVLNLIINARDATPKGGRITVRTDGPLPGKKHSMDRNGANETSYVRLTVSDTGSGMDSETKARVFEPFFTTKEQGKGTGLGLATVYGIVEQAGGHITVESEPGRGSCFEVFFPKVNGGVTEKQDDILATPTRGSETILVVEDQSGLRAMMCEILEQSGYSVLSAKDGREALHVAAQHPGTIHLLVTDLVMPEIGGREVVEALPAYHPETRVLYMSGYMENINELLADHHAFIDKPFSPEDLLRKIRQVLDKDDSLRRPA